MIPKPDCFHSSSAGNAAKGLVAVVLVHELPSLIQERGNLRAFHDFIKAVCLVAFASDLLSPLELKLNLELQVHELVVVSLDLQLIEICIVFFIRENSFL